MRDRRDEVILEVIVRYQDRFLRGEASGGVGVAPFAPLAPLAVCHLQAPPCPASPAHPAALTHLL